MPEEDLLRNFMENRHEKKSIYEMRGDRFLELIKALLEVKKEKGDGKNFRTHQIEAVLKTKQMLDRDNVESLKAKVGTGTGSDFSEDVKPIVIVAPPGAGKSGIIAMLPYCLKAKKCLILTPSKIISQQLAKSFGEKTEDPSFFDLVFKDVIPNSDIETLLEPVTLISNSGDIKDKKRMSNLVIVNAQRFAGKSKVSLVQGQEEIIKDVKEFFSQFDLLLVDEAHHYPAETWMKIVEAFSAKVEGALLQSQKKIVFLTATPYRNGPNGRQVYILQNLRKRIAYRISAATLEGRFIRKAEFIEYKEFSEDNLARDIKAILAEQKWKEPRFTPQAMIIVSDVYTAKKYANLLNESEGANFAVALYKSGNTEAKANQDIKEFSTGAFRVGIVCGLLNEGYNNPDVCLCVILRNIRSQILFSQFTGRCRRMTQFVGEGQGGEEELLDQCTGTILSYTQFQQKPLWEGRDKLATKDPTDIDEDLNFVEERDYFGMEVPVFAEPIIPSTPSSGGLQLVVPVGPMDEAGGGSRSALALLPVGFPFHEVDSPDEKPDVQELDREIAKGLTTATAIEVDLPEDTKSDDQKLDRIAEKALAASAATALNESAGGDVTIAPRRSTRLSTQSRKRKRS